MKSRTGTRRGRLALAILGALALSLVAMASVASASAKDRNHDRIPDRWEKRNHLSLKVKQTRKDQDRDGLRNLGEFKAKTDPRDADTDNDGIEDGDEGAGTITAWDPSTGQLTIDPFNGDPVTGMVTDQTQIDCNNDDATEPDDPADEIDNEGDDSASDRHLTRSDDDDDDTADDPSDDDSSDDPSDDDNNDNEDEDNQDSCSSADLAVGQVVDEASAEVTPDGLVFVEIELG